MEVTNPLEALCENYNDDNIIDAEIVDPTKPEPEETLDEYGWSSEMRGAVLRANGAFNRLHQLGLHEHWLKNVLIPAYKREVEVALNEYEKESYGQGK